MFFLRPFSNPYILPLTIPQAEECLTQLKRLITCNDDTAKQDYGYDLKVKFLLGNFLFLLITCIGNTIIYHPTP